jgi:RTX calcium-binding nonapeptide repeat (4 copies)
MHLPTRTGPRRRTRRALVAAALAACALPAGASAAVIEDVDGALTYRASSQETNTVTVRNLNGGMEVSDLRGVSSRTPLCVTVTATTVRCATGVALRRVLLGDRNDRAEILVPDQMQVDGGLGDDTFIAGGGQAASRVDYVGNGGFDRISYANADRAVSISNNNNFNDGRIGLDNDNVRGDIEQLGGSRFNDTITDVPIHIQSHELIGGPGNDTLRGGDSESRLTVFNMGPFADGADTIIGGGGLGVIDYSKRSRPVTATLDFNGADDGEAGERDQILGRVWQVSGGQADDTLRARPGSTHGVFLDGGGGDDTLEGADGPDLIYAFSGRDTVLTNGGNDMVNAKDGLADTVGCGLGDDSADLDSLDGFSSCETRRVGVLRLAPRSVRAAAGETVRLRLSWRHPKAWRKLRTIELRLTQGALPMGTVTIRPRSERIDASGALRLDRDATRLTREGKTVTVRLALRLDRSLAGQRLRVEVEATDRRGARQLERDAGTIRVTR